MAKIHPAIAEHVMEENEKLRGLLGEVRVLLANSSYKISGTAAFLHSIDAALSQQAEPAPAQDEREAFVAWATRLYNTGYLAGHHDTVEAGYTHVYQQDMDSYHEEVVEEWLTDNPQPASLTRPAQTAPQPEQSGWISVEGCEP